MKSVRENYIVHLCGKYNANTLKRLTVIQNLKWLEEKQPTRIEYVNNNGRRGIISVVLTGIDSEYCNIYENLKDILNALNQEVGQIVIIKTRIISPLPIKPYDILKFYKRMKNKTDKDWFFYSLA